jgi:protein ImuB
VAEAARPRAMQGGLFLPSFPDPEKLELTIARIANVVGERNVGSPEIVDTYRPVAIRMRRFSAVVEGAETVGADDAKARASNAQEADEKTTVSFRAFRPEIPAKVELHDGRPVAVIFQGARGDVRAAAGPWRTSGDWWREDEWEQEEWDLEVGFSAPLHLPSAGNVRGEWSLYRVCYEARRKGWFVRGIYD